MDSCQQVSYTAIQHIILLGWQGSVCPSQGLHAVQGSRSMSFGKVKCLDTTCLQACMRVRLVHHIAVPLLQVVCEAERQRLIVTELHVQLDTCSNFEIRI